MFNYKGTVALLLCLGAASARPQAIEEKPEALLQAERARAAATLRTAKIEYSELSTTGVTGGTPEARPARYFTWRCAADDYATVWQGDDEGVVMRDIDGVPRDDLTYNGPWSFLVKGGELWNHVEHSPLAEVLAGHRAEHFRLVDFRTLGLNPVEPGGTHDEALRASGLQGYEYIEVVGDDGLHEVSFLHGPFRARWWIDSKRGWNVVRTAVERDGQEISGMRAELAQFDGVWFPEEFEFRRLGADGRQHVTVTRVLSAEFNQPHHPQVLTPADIGIEPGMTVNCPDRTPSGSRMWDGTAAVLPEEFFERLEKGEVTLGPIAMEGRRKFLESPEGVALMKEREKRGGGGTVVASSQPALGWPGQRAPEFITAWERYTRDFIREHRLDAGQARRAWALCRECQDRGRAYLRERGRDFEALEERAAAAQDAAEGGRAARASEIDERRKELIAPMERLFEERLKPGLERLLTKAQRAGTEAAP